MSANYKRKIFRFKYTTSKVLFQLTIILFIAVFFIIRFCQYPLWVNTSFFKWLFIPNCNDGTLYNISISYIAAYIFYLLQVHLPARINHKKGLQMLMPYISNELLYINELIIICQSSLFLENNQYTLASNNLPYYFKLKTNSKIYLFRFTYSKSYEDYKMRLQNIHDTISSNANLGLLDSSFLFEYSNIPLNRFIKFMDQVACNTIEGKKVYFSSIDVLNTISAAINNFCVTYNINIESEIITSVSDSECKKYELEHSSSALQEIQNATLII